MQAPVDTTMSVLPGDRAMLATLQARPGHSGHQFRHGGASLPGACPGAFHAALACGHRTWGCKAVGWGHVDLMSRSIPSVRGEAFWGSMARLNREHVRASPKGSCAHGQNVLRYEYRRGHLPVRQSDASTTRGRFTCQ